MWYKKVTIETKATKEQIWKIWSNVEDWNTWDNEIEYSKLNGNFEKGNQGVMKPKNNPKSKFELISVEELKSFSTLSLLPLTKMEVFHEIEEKQGKVYLTHGIKISGLLTFLFSKIIGEKILKELPHSMNKLSQNAEEN